MKVATGLMRESWWSEEEQVREEEDEEEEDEKEGSKAENVMDPRLRRRRSGEV